MHLRARAHLGVTVFAAATFGLLLASYSALRPVRDALVLDKNPDSLPELWIATFVAMSVVSPVWSALLRNRSRRRFVGLAFHFFVVCEIGFFFVMRADARSIVVGRVFYVWSGVFNLFVVSVFWSLLNDLLGPRTARKLYGPIAAGGTIGTFVGPLLTRLLVESIGAAGVLVTSMVMLELAVVGVYCVRRAGAGLDPSDGSTPEEPPPPPGGGAFTGIASVLRTPYLSLIAGYVLCTATAATFLYLTQAHIVFDAHLDRDARTSYFATIDIWVAVIAFVLQTAAGPMIRWLGPGIVLMALPIVQTIGIWVLTATPSLSTLAIVQVIGRSATHGLTRPSRELLFTVIPRDDKYRAKNAIDTIAFRFGDLASSWVFKGLTAIAGSAVAIAAIPLLAIWLAVTALAGIGFHRRAAMPAEGQGNDHSGAIDHAPGAHDDAHAKEQR